MAEVYILKMRDGSYYVGSTDELKSRLVRHQSGRVTSTKKKLPFTLEYIEIFETKGEAQSREYQIKKWKSRKAIERLIKNGAIV